MSDTLTLTPAWTPDAIRALLDRSVEAVERAVVAIYRRQTEDETRGGSRGCYGKNLATGAEFTLTSEGHHPIVSGDYVVWTTNSGDIWGKNLLTSEAFPICTNPAEQSEAYISGNTVVWVDYRNGSEGDIYGATIPEPATLSLLAVGALALLRRR